jgi:GPH family glycoside/pentoside/hexuronide:cation symporter
MSRARANEHRLPVMASYGMGRFLAEFLTGAFGAIVFKYYETEVGLSAGYAALATIIYSIWNAANDPLIGYITAKPTILSKKLGRRFPWIALGALLCSTSFILIFSVPKSFDASENPLPVFAWMVVTICLYDGLYSIWEVNYQSIFPDRFRGQRVRTQAAGISTFIGVFGIAAGFIIPPLFFEYGNRDSYLLSGWVIAGIAVAAAMLLMPGVRETPDMVRRYMRAQQETQKSSSFFKELRFAFSFRNFVAFILLYFFYQSAAMSMTSSVHYVGDYVLQGSSSDTTLIFAGLLVGALLGVPLWTQVSKRVGSNQKMLVYTAVLMALFSVPMTFISSYTGFTIVMTLWGIGFGGFWLFMPPAMADVIDEVVVTRKRRDDGVLLGFRAFFGRLSYASQAITFFVIHRLTGFAENPRSASAVFGIHLHMGLIPALFLAAGLLVFISMNTLTPEIVALHKQQLVEHDL